MSLLSNLQLFVPPLDPSNKAINQAGTTGHQSNSAPRRGVGLSNLPAFLTAQNQGQPLRFHRQRAGIHPAPTKNESRLWTCGNIMEIVEISWKSWKYHEISWNIKHFWNGLEKLTLFAAQGAVKPWNVNSNLLVMSRRAQVIQNCSSGSPKLSKISHDSMDWYGLIWIDASRMLLKHHLAKNKDKQRVLQNLQQNTQISISPEQSLNRNPLAGLAWKTMQTTLGCLRGFIANMI